MHTSSKYNGDCTTVRCALLSEPMLTMDKRIGDLIAVRCFLASFDLEDLVSVASVA